MFHYIIQNAHKYCSSCKLLFGLLNRKTCPGSSTGPTERDLGSVNSIRRKILPAYNHMALSTFNVDDNMIPCFTC